VKAVIRAFAAAVRKMPAAIVVLALALTALFGFFARQVEIAQGNEGFAPDNPEIAALERVGDLFGAEAAETVVQVVVRNRGGDVITADALRAVSAAVEGISQSEAAPLLSQRGDRPAIVSYLAPVQRAVAEQGLPLDRLDDATVKQIYQQALAQTPPEQAGFITGLLGEGSDPATAVADAGLLLVFLAAGEGGDSDEAFDRQIEIESSLADAVAAVPLEGGLEMRPFSFSLLFADQEDFSGEVGRLFGFAFLIIVAILVFVYWLKPRGNATAARSVRRSLADMGLTMLTIVMAITWMQGIGLLLQRAGLIDAFSPPTQIVPILLIGLGVDYAIHLIARYREELGEAGGGVDPAMRTAIGTTGVALTLATLTTAIGFLTNVFNPVPALKDFGLLSAVGILASFLLMLTFVPAVRELLDRRAEAAGRLPIDGMVAGGERVLPALMEKTAVLAERAAVPTLVVTLLLGVAGYYGLSQLETRFSFTDFLPEDAPAVETLRIVEEEFGGGFGETTEVLVEAPEGGDLATVELHNALVAANRALGATENVVSFATPAGAVASAASPLSVIQALLAPGPDGQPASPEFAVAALQAGLLADLTVAPGSDVAGIWDLAAGAAPAEMAGVLHRVDGGRVDALLFDVQTQAGEAGASELRDDLRAAFEPVTGIDGTSAIATSQNIVSSVIVESLSASQVSSLAITVFASVLVLVVNFWFENRRPFLGVITMLPVALVVLWTFGLMWLFGIPFGPVTATLAALAVGIGVPYTIHIARRFEEDRVRFAGLEDALRSTMRHTGGALAGSALTTMAGFGILVTSTLKPFQQMGQVTLFAIGLSLAGSVLVLPSLLALWEAWHRRRGHTVIEKETVSVV
jgi:predicted RND superfamily exporter protein